MQRSRISALTLPTLYLRLFETRQESAQYRGERDETSKDDQGLLLPEAPGKRRRLASGQWIRWSCDYSNPENRNVAQGQQTTDEMCMFVGTYWPRSAEMDWCVTAGSSPHPASRLLANGTKRSADFLDCWSKSPQKIGRGGPESSVDRYATQRCFTDSCTKVSGRAYDLVTGAVDPTAITCD